MKLAIFKVNQLGDNVVFLPVVQTLRRLRPEWDLFLYTSPAGQELFSADFSREQMLIVPTADFNGAWKRPALLGRMLSRSWREHFDASLVANDQGNVAHLLAGLAGGKVRVGLNSDFIKVPGGLTEKLDLPLTMTVPQTNWEIGRRLFERLGGPAGEWAESPPPPELSHLMDPAAPGAGRIVIHSGASVVYKRWFPERFQELANRLAERFEVIWVEQPHTPGSELSPKVRRVAPGSLREFVTLLRSASLLVANNSGPMNLASALGCPSVIISGPSHPVWDPFWYPERFLILRDEALPCLPCDGPGAPLQVCLNLASPLACMAYWSVDAVHARTVAWIEKWAAELPAS